MQLPDILTTNHPRDIVIACRMLSVRYNEDAAELQAAWQDKTAGAIWRDLAKVFDKAADAAEKICDKHQF